jgi:hypothetical protein
VTPGLEHTFTNAGTDLRWKANLTTSNINNTPTVQYFYIDADAKTELTTGDINITASVDPTLTFSLPSGTCDLGTFDSGHLKTCSYSLTLSTNAVNGYIAYVKADDNLRSGSNIVTAVSDGFVTLGHEEYGAATSDSDYASLGINKQVTDCNSFNNGTSPMPAAALTTSEQSFAMSAGAVSDDTVYLCHAVSISYATPPGTYQQLITITVVNNF